MTVLSAVLLSLLIGQVIKVILHWYQYRSVNLWVLLEAGGMPSAYSTITVALTMSIFYETSFSNLFMISAVFTIIVLNETMKVKRQQGIQSELMAKFIDIREIIRRKLTESLSHTPEQVFAGAVLGFFITSILYAF